MPTILGIKQSSTFPLTTKHGSTIPHHDALGCPWRGFLNIVRKWNN